MKALGLLLALLAAPVLAQGFRGVDGPERKPILLAKGSGGGGGGGGCSANCSLTGTTTLATVAVSGTVTSSVASGSNAIIIQSGAYLVFDPANPATRRMYYDGTSFQLERSTVVTGNFTASGDSILTATTPIFRTAGTVTGLTIRATTTNTATNSAIRIGASVALTTHGAWVQEIINSTAIVVARFPWEGGIQLNVAGTAQPACEAAGRGTIIYVQGGTGVAETIRACLKDPTDESYAWYTLVTST